MTDQDCTKILEGDLTVGIQKAPLTFPPVKQKGNVPPMSHDWKLQEINNYHFQDPIPAHHGWLCRVCKRKLNVTKIFSNELPIVIVIAELQATNRDKLKPDQGKHIVITLIFVFMLNQTIENSQTAKYVNTYYKIQGILIPGMSVCVGQAYKPHTQESIFKLRFWSMCRPLATWIYWVKLRNIYLLFKNKFVSFNLYLEYVVDNFKQWLLYKLSKW